MISRKEVLNHLGGHCVKCLCDDFRVLTIDHRFGGGNKERKVLPASTQKFYKAVLEDRHARYQILCPTCQVLKQIERGEYAQKKPVKPFNQKQVKLLLRIKRALLKKIG